MKTIYTEFTNWEVVGETKYSYVGMAYGIETLFSKSKENIDWSFDEEFHLAIRESKLKMEAEIEIIREKYNSNQII